MWTSVDKHILFEDQNSSFLLKKIEKRDEEQPETKVLKKSQHFVTRQKSFGQQCDDQNRFSLSFGKCKVFYEQFDHNGQLVFKSYCCRSQSYNIIRLGKNEVSRTRPEFHKALSKNFTWSSHESSQKRKRLVQMVNQQGLSLSKVSKKLKIKLTTARLIIKKFNETGAFPMRSFKKRSNLRSTVDPNPVIKREQAQNLIPIQQKPQQSDNGIKNEENPIVTYWTLNPLPEGSYFYPFAPPSLSIWPS